MCQPSKIGSLIRFLKAVFYTQKTYFNENISNTAKKNIKSLDNALKYLHQYTDRYFYA